MAVLLSIIGSAGVARAGTATPTPVAAPAPAAAKPFDEVAAGAVRLARHDLAGWAWALTAACDQGDALAQRQCRVVRDARAAALRGQTFVVEAEPDAFYAGAWDPAKKSITLTVRGCIACQPLDVDGKKLFIVSNKAAPTATGNTIQAAVIHETARTFDDDAAATKWEAAAVPRLKIELVFALPQGNPLWSRDGKDGIAVSVLGFRVVDPCDGGVVCSSGGASQMDPDRKSCGTIDEGKSDAGDATAPAETIVDSLEPYMIREALDPAMKEIQKCHETYGIDGDAKVKLSIAGDGTILSYELVGDFRGTPTGDCIAKSIKAVTFPKSRRAKTSFAYPIVLR
jgi:hypothetical protein